MSQFLDITFPKYVESDKIHEESYMGVVCISCLSQENPFINIISCKHSSFLECFLKYKMEHPIYVCLQCHRMLQKMYEFKQQVEECMQALNDRVPDVKPKYNLQISNIEITSIDKECETPITKSEYEIGAEVKVEHNFSDDRDVPLAEVKVGHGFSDGLDVPLAEVKKQEKLRRKRSAPQTVEEKYSGKLRTVTLSQEQSLEERREWSQEEKYLKLPYKCETCIVGFEFEMAWNSHVLTQHNKTGFTCDLCKSVLSSASSLKDHCESHLMRYECTICEKRYRDEYSAVQHYNELHSMAGPIMDCQCPLCDFTPGFRLHSMMEKNTNVSHEERKRKSHINGSSDDKKEEKRKRKIRAKYKRYREKKKNEVVVLPISASSDTDEKKREDERKQKNREKARRYRQKKKNEVVVLPLSGSSDTDEKKRKEERKQKNRENTRRYREKKKNEVVVLPISDSSDTDEKKRKQERKQKNAEKCKRYRDKKRASNLQTQNISNRKNVPEQIQSSQIARPPTRDVPNVPPIIHTSRIASPSTRYVPYVPPVLHSSTIAGPSSRDVPCIPLSHSNNTSPPIHISIEDRVLQIHPSQIDPPPPHINYGKA